MSAIVGVHGVWNYHPANTAAALSAKWASDLRAGYPGTSPDLTIAVAYYAPALRAETRQGADDDPDTLPPDIQHAINQWLDYQALPDNSRQGPATRPLRQALEWIANRSGLDSRTVRRFISVFFREVVTYLEPANTGRRAAAQNIVADTIRAESPKIVIAHSLGSVVAWETLWAQPAGHPIDLLLTLGSPLALPGVVYDRLTPSPTVGRPSRPPCVRRWVNLADPGDLVAVPRLLSRHFEGVEMDLEPTIGAFDFHRVQRYLANPTTAAVIQSALTPTNP